MPEKIATSPQEPEPSNRAERFGSLPEGVMNARVLFLNPGNSWKVSSAVEATSQHTGAHSIGELAQQDPAAAWSILRDAVRTESNAAMVDAPLETPTEIIVDLEPDAFDRRAHAEQGFDPESTPPTELARFTMLPQGDQPQ